MFEEYFLISSDKHDKQHWISSTFSR